MGPTDRSLAFKYSSTLWLELLDWIDDVIILLVSVLSSSLALTSFSSRSLRSTVIRCSLEVDRCSNGTSLIRLMLLDDFFEESASFYSRDAVPRSTPSPGSPLSCPNILLSLDCSRKLCSVLGDSKHEPWRFSMMFLR